MTAWRALCPLRIRVSISPRGSLIDIVGILLPARLDHARDQPGRSKLAQRDTRQPEFSVIAPRPAGQGAPVAVARFSGKLPLPFAARILAVMGLVSAGFLLFMLLTSNPFDRLLPAVTPASLKSLQGGYGDYLTSEVKKHDFRLFLSTPAEVMAKGVSDNVSSVYRNYDRA